MSRRVVPRFVPSVMVRRRADAEQHLAAGARYVADAARALGYENGLAGVDPEGRCLTADAPGEDDGFAPDGPPCGWVLTAYVVAWRRGARRRR